MRTTVRLDDDVLSAASKLQRERHIGLSEAINTLVRAGLTRTTMPRPFTQRSVDLGLRIDVSNIADALEQLDGADEPR